MSSMLIILFYFFFTPADNQVSGRWVIEKNSVFTIEGKSNVADFKCQTSQYLNKDTITIFSEDDPGSPLRFKGGLNVMIRWFNCEQQVMTKEMYRTLKEKEKPQMSIHLVNVGKFTKSGQKVLGVVDVNMAGVTKRFEILFEVNYPDKNHLSFTGIRQLSFSDFKLKPPNKLAGLVKVEENILVRFKIILRGTA
jgi:hypothetical protein